METGSLTLLPTVLTAMSAVAAILLGVWAIIARYDNRLRGDMNRIRVELSDRIDKQGDRSDQQGKDFRQQIEDQGKDFRQQIEDQGKDLRQQIEDQGKDLRQRIEDQGKETNEQLGQLRERMAKLEGLLEGLREAVTGKRAA
jgi:polyhydroxyalkanoate synthesis regulator phasin